MEEEPPKVGGSYPRYVKPKKKASGRSAKRPAEGDPGTEVPTDAAGESTRLQESLVIRAKDLDERLPAAAHSLRDCRRATMRQRRLFAYPGYRSTPMGAHI